MTNEKGLALNRNKLLLTVILIATLVSTSYGAPGSFGQGEVTAGGGHLKNSDAVTITANPQSTESYYLDFSTYLGGSDNDAMGDIAIDSQGNIYITGWTESPDFPTTPGAYDRNHNGGIDGYVMKLGPNGNLIWSTYLGGPNTDLTYSIGIDSQGYVYVTGIGGRNFPTTPNAFQPNFNGMDVGGPYGECNAVVVKLKPDGSDLDWSSYWGTAWQIRDLDIGPNNDVYVIHGYMPSHNQAPFPSAWFTNAFQNSPQGDEDMVLARIKSDGSQILWATYLGGSGYDMADASLAVDGNGFVYVATMTESTDIPTPNGCDQTYNGKGTTCYGADTYVAKLTPDGSNMVWGTYLGGTDSDGVLGKHGIAVDAQGTVYVGSVTCSDDFPTTTAAFQTTYGGTGGGTCPPWGSRGDWAVTKLTTDGQLEASTFVGGRDGDGGEGITLDPDANVYLSGQTCSDNFPVTAGAFQSNYSGNSDAAFFKLSSDLSQLLYASYMGTTDVDIGRALGTDSSQDLCLGGTTKSATWPTQNPFQDSYAGGPTDAIIAKFTRLFEQYLPITLKRWSSTAEKDSP